MFCFAFFGFFDFFITYICRSNKTCLITCYASACIGLEIIEQVDSILSLDCTLSNKNNYCSTGAYHSILDDYSPDNWLYRWIFTYYL